MDENEKVQPLPATLGLFWHPDYPYVGAIDSRVTVDNRTEIHSDSNKAWIHLVLPHLMCTYQDCPIHGGCAPEEE